MNDQKKNSKSKNPFKESSSQMKNKITATQKKNNLKLEIKEKESIEKTEERIDLSKLYLLLETGFNKMSS